MLVTDVNIVNILFVRYVVCFDLSKPLNQQVEQLHYWLNFLDTSLTAGDGVGEVGSAWKVALVGLQAGILFLGSG